MKTLIILSLFFFTGCAYDAGQLNSMDTAPASQKEEEEIIPEKSMADLATILSRKEVPILCYHNIRNFKPGESDRMKSYTVTPAAFAEQMKALADSGYKTILPDQLYDYLLY